MYGCMIPNELRPNLKEQEFIVRAIDSIGFEPFHKPIHLYTRDEVKRIGELYQEVRAG